MSRPTIASIEESAPAEDPDQSGFVSELDCVHASVARRGDVSDRVVDVEDPFDRMAQPTTEDIEGLTSDLATPSSPKTTHARGEGRHLGALAPERPYPTASSRRAPDARHGASNRRLWTHHDPSLIPPTVGRLESGLGRRRHRERATATHQESGPRRLALSRYLTASGESPSQRLVGRAQPPSTPYSSQGLPGHMRPVSALSSPRRWLAPLVADRARAGRRCALGGS